MSCMDKAQTAWGHLVPDWVKALAESCDASSLRKAAENLEISPATVSLAINRKRKNLEFAKGCVEKKLMVTIVGCPVLGVIGVADCKREQSMPYSAANPLRVQLYRACRNGCPHSRSLK